jgi:hypothetical protein
MSLFIGSTIPNKKLSTESQVFPGTTNFIPDATKMGDQAIWI